MQFDAVGFVNLGCDYLRGCISILLRLLCIKVSKVSTRYVSRCVAKGTFMRKHILILQCTGGGMGIVKLPQAAVGRERAIGVKQAHFKP